jgi:hypothetical protein
MAEAIHRETKPGAALAEGGKSSLVLKLTCPRCQAVGQVDWHKLQHGLRCHQCQCEFMIAGGGKVTPLADLPQLRYECPRCRQSGVVPAPLAGRSPVCPHCKLALERGPDQCLRGAEQSREKWKSAAERLKAERLSRKTLTEQKETQRQFIRWGAIGAGVVVMIAAIGFARNAWVEASPELLARQFVVACLAGDEKRAAHFFDEEDAVQQVEFDRWRVRHFGSIADAHRSPGDRVRIEVEVLELTENDARLQVTLESPFMGERSHIERWDIREGKWLFNSLRTLADEERVPRTKR